MREELARVRRMTEMGQMAASIAHEINQPLAAIVTNGNAGLRWLVRESPHVDEAQATLQSIIDDAHRASEVIKSIRAMFQKNGQEKMPLDINELIREVLAFVDGEIRSQRVSVKTELIEKLPYVSANRTQLQQVIINLMTNAIEAMGSVTDRARVLRVKSGLHESDGLLITVEDSGTGVDPKDMDRIFDAFFTTKSTGMGMGLAICRSIIEAHGGRLCALAASPHGSIFQVALPKVDVVGIP